MDEDLREKLKQAGINPDDEKIVRTVELVEEKYASLMERVREHLKADTQKWQAVLQGLK
ncbi:MAG TPA: hypothetical protein VGG11_13680 [Xanthobacteraceae bacterium]|jgi:hypothetical protein